VALVDGVDDIRRPGSRGSPTVGGASGLGRTGHDDVERAGDRFQVLEGDPLRIDAPGRIDPMNDPSVHQRVSTPRSSVTATDPSPMVATGTISSRPSASLTSVTRCNASAGSAEHQALNVMLGGYSTLGSTTSMEPDHPEPDHPDMPTVRSVHTNPSGRTVASNGTPSSIVSHEASSADAVAGVTPTVAMTAAASKSRT